MLNAWGRLDVWVTSSGLLGPPSIDATTPADLQNCFEANSLAPFFALKYAPPAMGKLTSKGQYPNAAEKDVKYGSIIVVSSVASTYGGESKTSTCTANQKCIEVKARIVISYAEETFAMPDCAHTLQSHVGMGRGNPLSRLRDSI